MIWRTLTVSLTFLAPRHANVLVDCFSHLHGEFSLRGRDEPFPLVSFVLSGTISAKSQTGKRQREREVIEGHETNLRIGRSAARCIRLFPPINPSGFAEGHVTVTNDRSVYGDDDDEEDVVVVVVSRRTARA